MWKCYSLVASFTLLGLAAYLVKADSNATNARVTNAAATTTASTRAATAATSPMSRRESELGAPEPSADLKLELALLKQQNSILKGGQADLLQTVYWSLGTVVLLVLALTGFGWWTNFNVYERDKDTLASGLNTTIAGAESRLGVEVKSSLSAHSDEVNRKLISIESELNTKLTSVESALNKKLILLEYDLADLESDFRLESDSPSVAVTTGIKQLKLAIRLNSEWRAKYAIDSIGEAIDDGGAFYEREITETLQLLEKLPQLEKVEPEVVGRARALALKVRSAKIFVSKSE